MYITPGRWEVKDLSRLSGWCTCLSLSHTHTHTTHTPHTHTHTNANSKLYHFKYMLPSSDAFIPVATTRPETILGDTAVCVHPDDPR